MSSSVIFPDLVEDFILDDATPDSKLVEVNDAFKAFVTDVDSETMYKNIIYSCERFQEIIKGKIKALHSFVADCCGAIIDLSDRFAENTTIAGHDEALESFISLLDRVDIKCYPKDLYIIYVGGVNYVKKVQSIRLRCLTGLIKAIGAISGTTRAKFIAASLPSALRAVLEMDAQARGELPTLGAPSLSRAALAHRVATLTVEHLVPLSYIGDEDKDPHTVGRYTVAAFLAELVLHYARTAPLPALPPVLKSCRKEGDSGEPTKQSPTGGVVFMPAGAAAIRSTLTRDDDDDDDDDVSRVAATKEENENEKETEKDNEKEGEAASSAAVEVPSLWASVRIFGHCAAHVHPLFRRAVETQSALSVHDDSNGDLEVTALGLAGVVWQVLCRPDVKEVQARSNACPIPLIWSAHRRATLALKAAHVLLESGNSSFLRPALELVAVAQPLLQLAVRQAPEVYVFPERLSWEPQSLAAKVADVLATAQDEEVVSQELRLHGFAAVSELFAPLTPESRLRLLAGTSQLCGADPAAAAVLDLCRPALLESLNASQTPEQVWTHLSLICRAVFDDRERVRDSLDRLHSAVTTLKLALSHHEVGDLCCSSMKLDKQIIPQRCSILGKSGLTLPKWLRDTMAKADGPDLERVKDSWAVKANKHAQQDAPCQPPTTARKEIDRLATELGLELQAVQEQGGPEESKLRVFGMFLQDLRTLI